MSGLFRNRDGRLFYYKEDVDDMLKANTAGTIAGTTVFWVVIAVVFLALYL